MLAKTKTLTSPAPRTAYDPGSPKWCDMTLNFLQDSYKSITIDTSRFEGYLAELREHRAWEKVPVGNPYGSEDRMLAAELGKRADEIREQLKDIKRKQAEAQNRVRDEEDRKQQRPVGRPEIVYNNSSVVHDYRPAGNSAAAFLRRLRKDRPDIHARVLSGELSPHAGMIEAKFRKPPKPRPKLSRFEQIVKWWPTLTDEQKDEIRRLP
jgi:hypothetical protein